MHISTCAPDQADQADYVEVRKWHGWHAKFKLFSVIGMQLEFACQKPVACFLGMGFVMLLAHGGRFAAQALLRQMEDFKAAFADDNCPEMLVNVASLLLLQALRAEVREMKLARSGPPVRVALHRMSESQGFAERCD